MMTYVPQTWKTIELVAGKNGFQYLQSILGIPNAHVNEPARSMLEALEERSKTVTLELVAVTLPELGFPEGAYQKKIYARAAELGLFLCPPDVGPALRASYKDQPEGEFLTIAMKPVPISTVVANQRWHAIYDLDIERTREPWLHGSYTWRRPFLHPVRRRYVFARRP